MGYFKYTTINTHTDMESLRSKRLFGKEDEKGESPKQERLEEVREKKDKRKKHLKSMSKR